MSVLVSLNPVSDDFNLRIEGGNGREHIAVQVSDITGRIVGSKKLVGP